jgi:hypothetical protein
MESDCKDSSPTKMVSSSNADIIQMLTTISSQMTSNFQGLQDQMLRNDLHLSADFQMVVKDNDTFKQEVRAKLDAF